MWARAFIGALIIWSTCASATAQTDDLTFTRKAISFTAPLTGAGEALRIFDPTSDNLIVRTRDYDAVHRFHLFSADALRSEAPVPTQTITVPDNAIFYTLGEMPDGEQESLLIFTETGVQAYDPTRNMFAPLVDTRSLFRQGTSLRFQRSGFAQDLNDDQRFDLLIQDFDGLKVFLQRQDGTFTEPTLIPLAPEMRLTGAFSNDNVSDTAFSLPAERTPTFKIFPSYIADSTGDGASDIAFLVGRELIVFERTGDETFLTEPRTVAFPFEVRGNRWRDEILSAERNTDQRNFREVTVYRVLDMDDDGVLDVITVNNEASGLLDRDQEFRIYFGRMGENGLSYQATPDETLALDGIGGAGFRDLNDDGRKDLVVTATNINIGKIISFLINRRLSVQTRVYLDDGEGAFAEDRDFRHSRSIRIDLGRGLTTNPPYDYADFNGDGTLDLMSGNGRGRVDILAGGRGETLERKIGELRDTFPNEGALVTTEDINGDGKADIIVRYSPVGFDGEEQKRQLVLHLSE